MAVGQNQESPLYYGDLTRGRRPLAPPRSLTPDSPFIYRDSLNFVPRNGLIQKRPVLQAMPTTAKSLPPSVYDLTATTNGERPVWIYSTATSIAKTQTNVTGGINGLIPYKAFPLTASQTVSFVITNRQAFIYNEILGAWTNVTPTYTTGTVSVTNGSAVVTGAGTAWSTRGISPFQHIKLSGTWYQIYQINSDTQITLSQNFGGATAAGLAYEIKRTWGMGNSNGADRSSAIYAVAYNDSIIFGGALLGRADGNVTPTVIKVSGISTATPTTSYLTSSFALVSGLDTISISNISGLAVLADSRVVISADSSKAYYSSNLTDTVWSTSPGGFSVVEHKSGEIHAMEWLGANLCFHFDTGIVFGIPNGQSDPPLNFMDSHSTVGCVVPKTLREVDGAQIFMALDGQMFRFDGQSSVAIGDDIKDVFAGGMLETLKGTMFSSVNSKYGEYILWQYNNTTANSWTLSRDGSWWPSSYPAPIGALSEIDALSGVRIYCLAGIYTLDSGSEVNMVHEVVAGKSSDSVVFSGQNSGGHFIEFDDTDLIGSVDDAPLRYKSSVSLVVWFRGITSSTENFYTSISVDGGATWVDSTHKPVAVGTKGEVPVQFSFLDIVPAALIVRARISSESSSSLSISPTRLMVTILPIGDAGLTSL